jgi:hypothetical protein
MLDLSGFCEKYHVGDHIRGLLEDAGFKTAGALAEISEDSLKQAKLKIGEIGELKRAVREFISTEGQDVTIRAAA